MSVAPGSDEFVIRQMPNGDYQLVSTRDGHVIRTITAEEAAQGRADMAPAYRNPSGATEAVKPVATQVALHEALHPAAAETTEAVTNASGYNYPSMDAAASSAGIDQGLNTPSPTLMNPGVGYLQTGSVGLTDVMGAIGAAKGGYDTYQGWMHGGEGMRTGLTEMGAGVGSILLPGLGTVAGAAIGNIAGYGLQGNGWKNDLTLAAMGPMGWGLLAAKKMGLTSHKSTKQYQQERRDKLSKGGTTGLQQFENASRAATTDGMPNIIRDPSQEGIHSSYDYVSSLGNYETFGNDWDKLSLEDKAKVTAAIDQDGGYVNDHGDVLIKDKQAAIQAKDDVLSGKRQVDPGTNPYISNPDIPKKEEEGEGGGEGGGGGRERPQPRVSLADLTSLVPQMSRGPRYDLGKAIRNPYL